MTTDNNGMLWRELDSPIGPLSVYRHWNGAGVAHIEFGRFAERESDLRAWADRWWPGAGQSAWLEDAQCSLLGEAVRQLQNYFAGSLDRFTVPLDLRGTPFQRQVWQALTDIPFGEVRSYKQVAEAIGSPKAVRAVGGANNKNPVPIIVPCHRVIGADGGMVGYGGGLHIKLTLLGLEKPQTDVI
ncbi:methylated-DNA--[protein]-cysteine S-methyltransferase [Paenibacillus tarimensis]